MLLHAWLGFVPRVVRETSRVYGCSGGTVGAVKATPVRQRTTCGARHTIHTYLEEAKAFMRCLVPKTGLRLPSNCCFNAEGGCLTFLAAGRVTVVCESSSGAFSGRRRAPPHGRWEWRSSSRLRHSLRTSCHLLHFDILPRACHRQCRIPRSSLVNTSGCRYSCVF